MLRQVNGRGRLRLDGLRVADVGYEIIVNTKPDATKLVFGTILVTPEIANRVEKFIGTAELELEDKSRRVPLVNIEVRGTVIHFEIEDAGNL